MTHTASAACPAGRATPEAVDPGSGAFSAPGGPWGITASGVPNGDALLLFKCDGTAAVGNALGTGKLALVAHGVHGVGPLPTASVDPSGRYVAYVGPNGHVDYAGIGPSARAKDLGVSGSSPRISPDGQHIAFLDDGERVSVIGTNGRGLRRFLTAQTIMSAFSWFPDGHRLALLTPINQLTCSGYRPEQFGIFDTDTGRLAVLPFNESACPSGPAGAYFIPGDIAVSPDGSRIAISGAYSQCSPSPELRTCAGGEGGDAGLFFQGQLGTVAPSGGNLTVIRKLRGACIDPANVTCVDPAGGALAPANTDPTFQPGSLQWGGCPSGAATTAAASAGIAPDPSESAEPIVCNYVALGDSYASGEGLPPFSGDDCHRSERAYPERVRTALKVQNFSFEACSGATVSDLKNQAHLAWQRKALSPATNLVTITIGGNDIEFAELIRRCVKARVIPVIIGRFPDGCFSGNEALPNREIVSRGIKRIKAQLPEVLRFVREHAPNARIMLVGYPYVFPLSSPTDCSELRIAGVSIFRHPAFVSRDIPALHFIIKHLNDVARSIAQDQPVLGATFVSTASQFQGHDACNFNRSWFLGVWVAGRRQAWSLHPTDDGQHAIASAVIHAFVQSQ